jgi:hypothetical protein
MSRNVFALSEDPVPYREKLRIPWWMYPNVLSLDAPVVAVVWLYVLARAWDVNYVEPLLPVVLALVVWIVYAADRLLDCKWKQETSFPLRHRVHQQYEKHFVIAILLAALATAVISLKVLQWSIVQTAMLPLAATAGFFALSFFGPTNQRVSYSKNLLAGYAFAWGVGAGLSGLLGLPQPSNLLKLFAPEMLVFGLLCVINITAVDLWVKGSDELDDEADEWALTMPLMVLAFFSVLMMRTADKDQTSPFYVSMLIAAALMYVVNRMRRRLSTNFLRLSSDLILLIAALFFFLIH